MEILKKDLEDFVRGAAFFGAGGGGDPYIGRLMLEQQFDNGKKLTVIDVDDIQDDWFIVTAACMGAPTVMTEKMPSIKAMEQSLRAMEDHVGKKVDAIIPLEIGGINSTLPLVLAAKMGLPVINADGMGRAFPEIQMVTFGVHGNCASPVFVSDEHGDMSVVHTKNNKKAEDLARSAVISMGGQAQITCYPMSGKQIKESCVKNTLSLALEAGKSIRESKEKGLNPFEGLFNNIIDIDPDRDAIVLFDGKVVDIERKTEGGFNCGDIKLDQIDGGDSSMIIKFQNENVVAYKDNKIVAMVPDIIVVMDRETAEPLTSEAIRYGQRVKVVGLSVPDIMISDKALETFGPKAFGIDSEYKSITDLCS